MNVALCIIQIHLPAVGSLKEKRQVLRSLKDRLREHYNVAVAEVDHQDLWQRATLAVSSVAGEGYHLKRVMHEVERHLATFPAIEVIDTHLSLHGPDD